MEEGIGKLLVLSGSLEPLFWSSPAARRRLCFQDGIGSLFGSGANLIGFWLARRRLAVALCLMTALLQLLQLAWMVFHIKSYMRNRHTANGFQRLRHVLVFIFMSLISTTSELYPFHRAKTYAGTWRAFTSVIIFPILLPLAP